MINFLVLSLASLGFLQVPPAPISRFEQGLELRRELTAIENHETQALSKLVESLRTAGDKPEADEVTQRILPPYSASAPESFAPLLEIVSRFEKPEPAQRSEEIQIREQTLAQLLTLANKAAAPGVGCYSLADRCLREILIRDPDHAEARRLLGFVPTKSGWATPFAIEQQKAGKVRHPIYGWVPTSWVEHLDRDELPGLVITRDEPSQWLEADKADALRAEFFGRPWMITTPHFKIRANTALRKAIAFERRLEQFHDLFFSLLGDVIGRERLPLAQRFAKTKTGSPSAVHRYEVWFFADRADYSDYFKRTFRKDELISLGYFMPPSEAKLFKTTPRSYFYDDPNPAIDTESTLFHEASHQLLFESAGASKFERNSGHHWVWEGLGTYFETVQVDAESGVMEIGSANGPRMAQARLRLVERNEYIPIRSLISLDRSQFEANPAIYLHYAESMALTLFLMHGENGRYREGFLDYVRTGYEGRLGGSRGLDQFLGVTYNQLDAEFKTYLQNLPRSPE